MNRDAIDSKVRTVLAAFLRMESPLQGEISRSNTPAWDSLKHIEIMFALEDELGVVFSEAELAELDSVTKIVQAALAKHEA